MNACFANSFGQTASSVSSHDDKARNAQILKECREALIELASLREREAILKKRAEEADKLQKLTDERLDLYQKTVAEYEKAIEARKKAESTVDLLRINYEAQVKTMEKELANEKRKVLFWKIATGVAVVLGLASRVFNNN